MQILTTIVLPVESGCEFMVMMVMVALFTLFGLGDWIIGRRFEGVGYE